MIRLFLNSTLVLAPPKETDSLTEELLLSTELHGYIYQVEGALTFMEDEYSLLRELFDSNYCADVELILQISFDFGSSWITKVNALIKLSDCKWDRAKKQVECNIVDNSYLSKINNNKSIEFTLGRSGNLLSKNGVDVQYKFRSHANIQMFSPFRGRYFYDEAAYSKTSPPFAASEGDEFIDLRPSGRNGIFIWDALNLIIAMMTDDEVDFASNYFSYSLSSPFNSNPEAFAAIFSGQHLRFGSGYPTIKFIDLFDDLHKLCNVYFALETGIGGKPVFRVEQESYFRQGNSGVFFDSVKSMVENINISKIYSKVSVGCSQSSSDDFPIGEIPLVNHVQEEFPLSGQCNLDNELNLRLSKLIINTNSICKSLPSITGFNNGGSFKRKFTNEQVTAGSGGFHQLVIDSSADFQISLTERGFLIRSTRTNEWSYIDGIQGNTKITIYDLILLVDNTLQTKEYEIYKPSDDDSLDSEVFLIQLDQQVYYDSGLLVASKYEITPPSTLYFYNYIFANYKVIERHIGGVAQSIISSMSNGNDQFLAQLATDHTLSNSSFFLGVNNSQYRRIRFENDSTLPNFDTNNNYNPLNGIFICPQSGYYHAYCSIRFTNNNPLDFTQQVELVRVSGAGDVLESETGNTTILNGTSFTFTLDRVFYLHKDETLQVYVKSPFGLSGIWLNQFIPFSEFAGGGSYGDQYGIRGATDLTFFGIDALFNGGGYVPASDIDEASIVNIEGELSVNRDTFDNILSNPFKYYHLNYGPQQYVSGYIEKVSRGILNGETTLTMFKKQNGV